MKNLFFVKGNEKRPELVLSALVEKYPNLKKSASEVWFFADESRYYYIDGEGKYESCSDTSFMYKFLCTYGEEIVLNVPKKIKFQDKVVYQSVKIYKKYGDYSTGGTLYDTVEELIEKESPLFHKDYVIGYTEVVLKVPVEE